MQDAARKALQEAFAGTKDPFALDEERRKKRGGGGDGNGGGGGGGGSGGGFNFGEFSDGFKKWLKDTLRAIASVVAFFTFIALFYLWKPLLELSTKVVRIVLRLDGNRAQVAAGPAAQVDLSKKEGLGNVEESMISKYGAGDDGEEDETDDEE